MKAMNKLCLTILERVQGEVVISALLEVMTFYRMHDKSSEGKLAIKVILTIHRFVAPCKALVDWLADFL